MPAQPSREGDNDWPTIQRKLIWRMFFAVLMIFALLGALAIFDYLSKRSESEASFPQYTEPVPVTKKIQPRAVTAPEEPAMAKERQVAAEPEGSAAPVDKEWWRSFNDTVLNDLIAQAKLPSRLALPRM